jgi:hypothetical protein
MSNTFSVTVTSTEAGPTTVTAQYAMVIDGALILSNDPPAMAFPTVAQVAQPRAIYARGEWQSAIASTGAST